ncbi:tetratricopeptide repeat protein [Phosphitispora sp. TUW77]|uniref:tetratricopeptide repeat protein n=1 Tax=Phosphitispora sp. TUW77 TaxID=3152361 RepID=UPI003AB1F6B7
MGRVFCFMIFLIVFGVAIDTDAPDWDEVVKICDSQYAQRQVELTAPGVKVGQSVKEGWVYYNLGKYDMAKNIMQGVFEKDKNLSALYCLGKISLNEGNYESAAETLRDVLDVSPHHVPSLLNIGKAYYFSGRYHLAEQYFDQVLQLEPDNWEAASWIAKTGSRAGI